ncbi:MAG TPA: tripartite tricarboxylate transporter substrate binding protein [Beijerinckiaceae bacterium]|jgi:tripartite-type tricarboxylate transporter receptor subunit TctC
MPTLTRRSLMLAGATLPFAARAQGWPSGIIRIIVPFPPGGSVDAIARMVQPGLQQRLGATVIVENRPGSSGSIGAAAVAKAAPDGNTWLFVFDTHAVNPALIPNLPYDSQKDLDPVLLIGTAPNVLATHPSRPYRSLAEVIEAARARPRTVNFATVGAGSLGHLTMVLLSKRAGVELVHVPYRGGGPAINDAIAGHVDLIIASVALLNPHLQAGTLRGLVQTGLKRQASLSDLPTADESGFKDFQSLAWWGVYGPAGTPKPVAERFGAELTAVLKDERVQRQLVETQQITPTLGGPEELRKFFDEQARTWGAVVRENGIKSDT